MSSHSVNAFELKDSPRELTAQMTQYAKLKSSSGGLGWLIFVFPLSIPAAILYFTLREATSSTEHFIAQLSLIGLIVLWFIFFISLIRLYLLRKRLYPIYTKVLREGELIHGRVEEVETRGQMTRITQMVDVKINDKLLRFYNKNTDLIRYELGMDAEIIYHRDHPDVIIPMVSLIDFIESSK